MAEVIGWWLSGMDSTLITTGSKPNTPNSAGYNKFIVQNESLSPAQNLTNLVTGSLSSPALVNQCSIVTPMLTIPQG